MIRTFEEKLAGQSGRSSEKSGNSELSLDKDYPGYPGTSQGNKIKKYMPIDVQREAEDSEEVEKKDCI